MSVGKVGAAIGSSHRVSGMRVIWRSAQLTVLTAGLVLCAIVASGSPPIDTFDQEKTEALAAAEKLLEAFNRHDANAMAILVTRDFELYYFDQEGVASLAVRGPEELAREMTSYFARHPSVQSRIVGAVDGPTFVSFREQIVGGQSSLTVYEVRNELIRRAWYFPAED